MGLKFLIFSDAVFYKENEEQIPCIRAFLDSGYDLIDNIEIRPYNEESFRKGILAALKSHELVIATLPDSDSYTPKIAEWINRQLFPEPTRYNPFLIDGIPRGFFWEQEGEKFLLTLGQSTPIFQDIIDYLNQTYPKREHVSYEKIGILDTKKWMVDKMTAAIHTSSPSLLFCSFQMHEIVWVVATVKTTQESLGKRAIQDAVNQLHKGFGNLCLPRHTHSIEEAIKELMIEKKMQLSLAESCTGGEISSRLCKVSGASEYFLGSIVSYSNTVKERVLGVSPALIESEGAVSEKVAIEMAKGALLQTGSEIALAVTGIAGPLGGSDEKPVGTVYAAFAWKDGRLKSMHLQLSGTREQIISQTTQTLLTRLLRILT
ncbi:MAG: CinA family protein [Waddliaceae bacterium]